MNQKPPVDVKHVKEALKMIGEAKGFGSLILLYDDGQTRGVIATGLHGSMALCSIALQRFLTEITVGNFTHVPEKELQQ